MRQAMLLPGSSSTKELIIELLSEQWPLSAKRIFSVLVKKHGVSVTYQAVHKALKELSGKGVLEKGEKGYRLAEGWITGLGEFSARMKGQYESGRSFRETRAASKLVFTRNIDFVRFHIGFVERLSRHSEGIRMTFHFRHVPYPFKLSPEEQQKMGRLLQKMDWTILSRGATPLDRMFARFWRKLGVKVKVGVETASDSLIVTNEFVTQLMYPKEAIRAWDSMFEASPPGNMDIKALTDSITEPNFRFAVLVVRDREIAGMLSRGRAEGFISRTAK